MTSQELMDEFYNQPLYMSYSALNKLIYSPRLYHKDYILKQKEEEHLPHLIEGKLTHCLLLEEDKFNEQFVIAPMNLPSDNAMKVIEAVYRIHIEAPFDSNGNKKTIGSYGSEIISILQSVNLYQSLKTDSQRLDKIITSEGIAYFNFLELQTGKQLIDIDTYNRCKDAADAIKKHREASDLLGIYTNEMYEGTIINEYYMQSELAKYSFGVKGVIDNLHISHQDRVIYINDVKKTNKSLKDFPDSIETFNYWLQASIYKELVINNMLTLVAQGYSIKFNFIVIDRYNSVYCFEVSGETFIEWDKRMYQILQEAEWHYKNRNYDLPYALASTKFIL